MVFKPEYWQTPGVICPTPGNYITVSQADARYATSVSISALQSSVSALPWGFHGITVPNSATAGKVQGIWNKVSNPTNIPGYAFYNEYDNTGDVVGQNDINSCFITRHYSLRSSSASWGTWQVSLSPLNPSSGFATAPVNPQTFSMVMGELNPISRHSDCFIALDARHWVNWHGGLDLVPETFDPYAELGGERRGYNIPFAYGFAKSPNTSTDTQKHARIYFPVFGRPNAIGPGGAGTMVQGYIPFIVGAAVSAGGNGYAVGDVLKFGSGLASASNEECQLEVTSVNGSGAVTGVRVKNSGYYQSNPPSPCSVTGGSGTGATFTYTLSTQSTEIPRAAYGIGGGAFNYGIDAAHWVGNAPNGSDPGPSSFTGGLIRSPNNTNVILARNAADSVDIALVKLDTSNTWLLGQTGTPLKLFGPLAINMAELGNYANDAAAATGGVVVGGIYRNGSQLMVRVS